MATSPERCELERALVEDIFGNADSSSTGRVARRQTSGRLDADVRNTYIPNMLHDSDYCYRNSQKFVVFCLAQNDKNNFLRKFFY